MRKPHERVLFQVNKIHKPNCPTKKTNSKRKTLNGCCQICIKTVKMSKKREKPQGGRPWKLGERKWKNQSKSYGPLKFHLKSVQIFLNLLTQTIPIALAIFPIKFNVLEVGKKNFKLKQAP